MLIIALTGGVGSGKSTVSQRFAALGVPVVDADVIAHELTATGGAALDAVLGAFGPGVRAGDGGLDRVALRKIVFADVRARKRLEAILHPLIRRRMLDAIAGIEAPYALLVIPLLFETGQMDLAHRVLVVDLPEAEQIQRVQRRSGLDTEEIRRILSSQVDRSVRLAGADEVIDNSGDVGALVAQVNALHHRYLSLARTIDP
jgi:dephospho-CoA kinase